ncbi:MAG: alpha/beta fold hydrolase [Hyphomicrobium aestuarii]|nr:alpha/beta fold hydrolase [Hyphomicrobium aestuarii]
MIAAAKTLDIDGQPMPVWDAGPDKLPVLMFLHGWGLAPPAYRHLLTALSLRYRIVAPFIPGLCWNRPERAYRSHHDLAAVVLAVADRLGIERVHLAGQSTGGGIAAAMSAGRPAAIQSLVLIDASGLPRFASKWPAWARTRELVAETAREGVTGPGLAMTRSFIWNLVAGRGAMIRAANIPLNEDLSTTFAAIKAPTLILWGGRDLLFPLATAHEIQSLIPASTLHVVDGVHHSWEINGHREAARFIAAHIDRHTIDARSSQFLA